MIDVIPFPQRASRTRVSQSPDGGPGPFIARFARRF